jgi:hypothetical protein
LYCDKNYASADQQKEKAVAGKVKAGQAGATFFWKEKLPEEI